MIQKILALSILACFLFQNTAVFAQGYSAKALILARNELLQTKNGKNYVTQLEKVLPQMTETQLESILSKMSTLTESSQNWSKSQKELINYIDLAIQRELLTRNGEITQKELSEVQESTPISLNLKKSIETDIIAAQKLLQKNLSEASLSLEKTWESMSSYEETGNMSMDFDMNLENLGSIDSGISLKNYTAQQKDFDSKLTGQFEAFLNASFAGQDIQASGKSLIDFISKDGHMYLLAKNIETKLEPMELEQSIGTQDIVTKLKELAKTNTYIKFSDSQAAEGIEILRNLSPESALSESSKILETALFTPISQKGQSYVLIPTTHFCDTMKEISGVFDPLAGKLCSQGQYQDLLSDMQDQGIEILYTPGTNKKIQIILESESEKGNIDIVWNEKKLESITGKVIDIENPQMNFMTLSFIPQKSLEMNVKLEEVMDISLSSSFNNTGINTLNLQGTLDDTILVKAQYKNNYLTASLTYDDVSTGLSCSIFGPLTSTTSQLEGKCSFENMNLKQTLGSSKLDFIFTLGTNTSGNKNNIAFSLRGIGNKKEFMKFTLNSAVSRNQNAILNITAPSKSVEMTEIIESVQY